MLSGGRRGGVRRGSRRRGSGRRVSRTVGSVDEAVAVAEETWSEEAVAGDAVAG